MTREVGEAEITEAMHAVTEFVRNLERYQRGLDEMIDWPELSEDDAAEVISLIFAAATALDELALEVEGLAR